MVEQGIQACVQLLQVAGRRREAQPNIVIPAGRLKPQDNAEPVEPVGLEYSSLHVTPHIGTR
ncbi:hypothetical protein [Streptomyces himalayensis]|uniref:Uncharacterized protein n=1 Tax=Streptomyces himalayensis subsp. himalayensis TaxID=2756131 RepID=A0A7W0DU49_9ACTN|nr:hypothetical protein [Streptomyces himalayensis]MBA2950788.1 hypothetical protein [Streptomyces himalayensis subsp. himalayensis]